MTTDHLHSLDPDELPAHFQATLPNRPETHTPLQQVADPFTSVSTVPGGGPG
jgi:hypothetical protein